LIYRTQSRPINHSQTMLDDVSLLINMHELISVMRLNCILLTHIFLIRDINAQSQHERGQIIKFSRSEKIASENALSCIN